MLFSTKDKINKKSLDKLTARLHSPTNKEFEFYKLFSGYCDVVFNGKKIKQSNNYLIIGMPQNSRLDYSLTSIITKDFSSDKKVMVDYFNFNLPNNNIFLSLTNELGFYFISKTQEREVEAFLHLYRCFERMSIIFPLVYLRLIDNYSNVFEQLKSFTKGENTSDIKFFRAFQQKIFETSPILLDTPITISFDFISPDETAEMHRIFKNSIFKDMDAEIDYINNDVLIKLKHVFQLILNVRNRYFHYSLAQSDNIDTIKIEMNQFFKPINEIVLNWMGVLYGKIIQSSL